MKRILIIEDNQDVRENLAEILELDGYQIVQAPNGKRGVELAIENTPDLILCDVMMPELDGYGVLKIVNRNENLRHIPFMFLTAKSEKEDFRRGMGLGADDYITKPFDDVELLQSIEIRLKKSEEIRSAVKRTRGKKFFIDSKQAIQDLLALSDEHDVRSYRGKDKIYEFGQYPQWIFYVEEGIVKTCLINDYGKELITHLYAKDEFFGFLPCLNETPYHDYAVALEDCKVRLIKVSKFKKLLNNNADLMGVLLKMLSNHALYSENQSIEYAYSSVRKKVANALLILHEKYESEELALLRDDLAGLAATAKETVIRTISDFKKEGLVKTFDHSIGILDPEGLRKMMQ
jgi:CheY-like chemotaxis protein